jgi:hypothetical protein
MRRSASTAPERETKLNALLLFGSIRLFGIADISVESATECESSMV